MRRWASQACTSVVHAYTQQRGHTRTQTRQHVCNNPGRSQDVVVRIKKARAVVVVNRHAGVVVCNDEVVADGVVDLQHESVARVMGRCGCGLDSYHAKPDKRATLLTFMTVGPEGLSHRYTWRSQLHITGQATTTTNECVRAPGASLPSRCLQHARTSLLTC